MRPAPTKLDVRRVPLERGQIVAFNLSGNVARGEVVRVTPSATFIRVIDGGYSYYRDGTHVSRVRNGSSIMVLQDGDHLG